MFHLILIQYLYTNICSCDFALTYNSFENYKIISRSKKASLCLNWYIFPQVDFGFLESSSFLLISFSGYNIVLYNIKNTQQILEEEFFPRPLGKIHYSHTIH